MHKNEKQDVKIKECINQKIECGCITERRITWKTEKFSPLDND